MFAFRLLGMLAALCFQLLWGVLYGSVLLIGWLIGATVKAGTSKPRLDGSPKLSSTTAEWVLAGVIVLIGGIIWMSVALDR